MTTAHLSVGLKTQPARQALLELKAWMKKEMAGALTIDSTNLVKSVQAELSKIKLRVNVDTDALRAEVGGALNSAFSTTHRVNIDAVALAAQVRAAVSNGMSGAGGAPVGGGAAPAAISAALVPAIDRMVKSVEDAVQARAPRAAGSSRAVVGPTRETLYRLRDQDTVDRDRVVNSQADANRTLRFRQNWQKNNDDTGFLFGPSRADMNRLMDAQAREMRAAMVRSAGKVDPRALLGLPSRDEMKTLGVQLAAQMRGTLADEALRAKSAGRVDPRTLLGLPGRDEMKTLAAQIAGQLREGVAGEALRVKAAGRVDPRTLLGLPSREEMQGMGALIAGQMRRGVETENLRTKSAGRVDPRELLGLPSQREMSTFTAQIKAQMREAANAQKGVVPEDEKLRRVIAGTKSWSAAMNDVHSAARGLAGSMGGMWLTWGSTVPLVAFAALGASIRSVYTVGKDLEFQLAFVKVLSDGTTVSLKEFGAAVRGSMVAPVEAAQAMRALAQNGLNAQEALQALPAILNLATAGEMSLTEAALGATGVMAAFNLQVSDLGRIGDVFAKAAALSNTSVNAMVEAMKQASTVSDQYHVGLEETAASLAVMAKRNIEGSAAGTAFRNMMTELATPTKKAKEAMAALGLELYDRNNQLRSFTDILGQLKDKTATLNEKGRLAFLRDIFDERGAKAANALLSDYELFGRTLETLKTKAEGFTRAVNDALAQTTEGKIRRLVSEFQLATSSAFDEISVQVGNFVDQLRAAASSTEFKQFLKTVTEAVISLSRFFVEHHEAIMLTVGGWIALRGVMLGIEMWTAARTAIAAVTAGLATMRVTALSALGAMTGGLALIVALAAEFLLLRTHTDEATEAQRAFDNQLKIQSQALDDSLSKLKAQNTELQKRVDLQKQGYSADQAKKLVEDAAAQKDKLDVRDRARSDLAKAEEQQRAAVASMKKAMADGNARPFAESQAVLAAGKVVEERRKALQEAESNYTKWEQEQSQKRLKTQSEEQSERLRLMKEFNDQLYDFRRRSGKGKEKALEGLFITQGEATTGSRADFDALLQERKAKLNTQGGNYTQRDKQADAAAHRDAMAASRQIIDGLRQEEAAAKQSIKFARELNEARFSASQFGPYMAAKIAEQESIQETERLLNLEKNAVLTLVAAKSRADLTSSDRTNLDTEINRRRSAIDLMEKEAVHRRDLIRLKAEESARQSVLEEERTLRGLADGDARQLGSLSKKYDQRVVPGAIQAQREAELQVEERYREAISQKELKIKDAKQGVLLLAEMIDQASGDEVERLKERHEIALRNLETEQARLAVMQAQSGKAKEAAGTSARAEYEKSQTAQYGWDRFWKEYVEQGTSSAQIVYDAMKVTSRGMEDALMNFILKGKSGFKSLVSTILAEVARMLAMQAIKQFIGFAMSFIGAGSGSSGGTVGGFNGSAGTGLGATYAANGHVMTSDGPLQLRKYAAGGVARRPQLAVFGEGDRPEAYVPLPDGRTIPVTMSGGGRGGDTFHVSTAVHLHSDGRTEVETDSDSRVAALLGKKLDAAVIAVLEREKRPGGSLYRTN